MTASLVDEKLKSSNLIVAHWLIFTALSYLVIMLISLRRQTPQWAKNQALRTYLRIHADILPLISKTKTWVSITTNYTIFISVYQHASENPRLQVCTPKKVNKPISPTRDPKHDIPSPYWHTYAEMNYSRGPSRHRTVASDNLLSTVLFSPRHANTITSTEIWACACLIWLVILGVAFKITPCDEARTNKWHETKFRNHLYDNER